MSRALVIGAGPAGLMAAGQLLDAGLQVTLADAMATPARKFLMAGKSGLNLTRDEPLPQFLEAYGEAGLLRRIVAGFGPDAVRAWARDLGADPFTGTSGKVFPRQMKASPLLRAWLARISAAELRMRWHWRGWKGDALAFDTPAGRRLETPDVTVLALGGASWPRLGSRGDWVDLLQSRGVALTPFCPANAGLAVTWSPHMARHFGVPVKAASLQAGAQRIRGEFVISKNGLEGSAVYAVSRAVREGAPLFIDLLPDLTLAQVKARLQRTRGKASLSNFLRKALKLDPARIALLNEFGRPLPAPGQLAGLIKAVPVRHDGLRPLQEAISTAGGVAFDAVDEALMLRDLPGVFVAGEMLDWEAPTGGYLITACLATGRHAGRHAARWAGADRQAPGW